ncbi:hypothetical protein MWN33_18665 [Starkeya koreensis]|uniref:Uncharacterized protein n=1 Tax=Ancylobacter koreensis TaxID=266121 RepID=A0ABT0DS06_9HYPH|nr:hypothetical protein [Ancylobacter koreensis]MCK0210059.1 hypothetical protein [Ancylobacter koreensis]
MPSVMISVDKDLPDDCAYVDALLQQSLKAGKVSRLMRNQLVVNAAGIPYRDGDRAFLFGVPEVCEALRVLEGHPVPDTTKGPFHYTSGPLEGLQKKHFFQASFIPQNILNELGRNGTGPVFREFAKKYGKDGFMGKPITQEDLKLIVETLVTGSLSARMDRREKYRDGGLTGEHIVFAETPVGNRYLCLSHHGEDFERVADAARVCLVDFPEIADCCPATTSKPEPLP